MVSRQEVRCNESWLKKDLSVMTILMKKVVALNEAGKKLLKLGAVHVSTIFPQFVEHICRL